MPRVGDRSAGQPLGVGRANISQQNNKTLKTGGTSSSGELRLDAILETGKEKEKCVPCNPTRQG